MRLIVSLLATVCCTVAKPYGQPYLYNPYPQYYRYDYPYHNGLAPLPYGNHIPGYIPYVPQYSSNYYPDNRIPFVAQPVEVPTVPSIATLNVLAEIPYKIKNKFTVVPMFVMANENINILENALILQASRQRPVLTVKTADDVLVECTPAVKVLLNKPLQIYSLKADIPFPAEIEIAHEGFKIPIRVGAVIAAIPQDVFVSPETPVPVHVLYAIPTKPFVIDYVNNEDVSVNPDTQAVIVESDKDGAKPPKNVTVLDFPANEAEPSFQVDEEDEELVNRNPPMGVVPAGIVQSTQPHASLKPFVNSKESPLLNTFREEAAKNKINNADRVRVAPAI